MDYLIQVSPLLVIFILIVKKFPVFFESLIFITVTIYIHQLDATLFKKLYSFLKHI
jgi:hypothetical protein